MITCSLDILFQTTQSFLCTLKNIIILAHRKSEVVLGDVCVGVSIELRGRDRSNANLLDQEPAELEVTRAISDVRWEWVVCRELDRGHVGQDKVSAFGIRVLVLNQ